MKKTIIIVIVIIILIAAYAFYAKQPTNTASNTMPSTTTSPVQVMPISHATMVLGWGDTAIYTDPIGGAPVFAGKPAPNIILVTDIHADHFSTSTLEAITGSSTLIVPQAVKDLLPKDLASRAIVMKNGDLITEQGFNITAIPMYNLPEASTSPHTKGRGNGYLIEKGGFRIYVAGDTSGTPEMRALKNIDIAFVPMNPPYTMSVEEAADAVLAFKPKQVYPYHYRGPNGLNDVNKFKQLVNAGDSNIDVILANWYSGQ